MGVLLDMSLFPLPSAVEELDYATLRAAWLADYAERMSLTVSELDDNDPAVRVLETGAYRELLVRQRINDAVRRTLLASAYGRGLDDLGADPLYNLPRLVLDPGDPSAAPPRPPVLEDDRSYRERLAQAPAALSSAGPAGAYRTLALRAHPGVVDTAVSSPAPCEVLVEILFDATRPGNEDTLAAVTAALSDRTKRPIGDRLTVRPAAAEATDIVLKVLVDEGPDLEAVRRASQSKVRDIVLPLAARVRSGLAFSAGGAKLWRGAAMVAGVVDVQEVSASGQTNPNAAWWPMTITVQAERFRG